MTDEQAVGIILLSESQRDCLVRERETGMGYQLVEAEVDGTWQQGMVLNGELLVLGAGGEDYPQVVQEVAAHLGSEALARMEEPVPLRLLYAAPHLKPESQVAISAGRPNAAIESPQEKTEHGQAFVRFSAFKHDFRITPERGLVSGSFTTTIEDARGCLEEGDEIVARYALPNPELPRFAFRVEPPGGTPLQRGTVQPAFNQPGGGVEAYFCTGTAPGTVGYPHDILDGALNDSPTERKMEQETGQSARVRNGLPGGAGSPEQWSRFSECSRAQCAGDGAA